MVFCNKKHKYLCFTNRSHNPYFNRWFSAIDNIIYDNKHKIKVTILILIDGFLQFTPNATYFNMYVGSQSLF